MPLNDGPKCLSTGSHPFPSLSSRFFHPSPNREPVHRLRFIDGIFAIWDGPKGVLLEFLDALNSKTDRIKLTYCISDSSISFFDLFPYRDISSSVLQFSTFQKPLNKYFYMPFESFHPSSNKNAFIKGGINEIC